jgi:MFS family permease
MSGYRVAVAAGRLVPPTRYRHPGDVIRLIAGSAVLGCSLAAAAAARRWLLGPAAPVTGGLGSGLAGRVLTGLVPVAFVAAAALVVAATLRRRRFRLLGGLGVAAAVAAGIVAGIFWLLGGQHPDALTDNLARGSWLASAASCSCPWLGAGYRARIARSFRLRQRSRNTITPMPMKAACGSAAAPARTAVDIPAAAATSTTPTIRHTAVQRGRAAVLMTAKPNATPPATIMAPCSVSQPPNTLVTAVQFLLPAASA